MIEVKDLYGRAFLLNCELIETVDIIPVEDMDSGPIQTKILLTTDKYYLVSNTSDEILQKIVAYQKEIRSMCKALANWEHKNEQGEG